MQLLTLKCDVSSTNVIMEHTHCNRLVMRQCSSKNGAYLRPHVGAQTSLHLHSECACLKGNLGRLAHTLLPVMILS